MLDPLFGHESLVSHEQMIKRFSKPVKDVEHGLVPDYPDFSWMVTPEILRARVLKVVNESAVLGA